MSDDSIHLPNAPALPGLRFRRFQGDSDFPLMAPVANACFAADKTEIVRAVDEMRKSYAELVNCDPYDDMILAEMDGELIGYIRGWWWAELAGSIIYCHLGFVMPAWRRKGIGRAMPHWMLGFDTSPPDFRFPRLSAPMNSSTCVTFRVEIQNGL